MALFRFHGHKLVITGDGGTGVNDCLKQVSFGADGSDPGEVRPEIHPLVLLDVTGDTKRFGRVIEKFLSAKRIPLGQEFGKPVEPLRLAGLFGRIRFDGIGQLDLGHDVLRRAPLVDLMHELNLFAHRVTRRKTLFTDLIQGIDNGMLQKRIRFGQACFKQRFDRPAVPYPAESHGGQPALTSITRIEEPK